MQIFPNIFATSLLSAFYNFQYPFLIQCKVDFCNEYLPRRIRINASLQGANACCTIHKKDSFHTTLPLSIKSFTLFFFLRVQKKYILDDEFYLFLYIFLILIDLIFSQFFLLYLKLLFQIKVFFSDTFSLSDIRIK